ncbi:MAG: GIY-YIG nuclease family protein [Clostridiales bacterium]|nr:GIY-YIG nuclease family protein [Clostridiales bacterium]
MLTNKNNRVLYTGITNNLERRVYQHKNKLVKGFTEKYNVNRLVYFDYTRDVNAAIAREKQIKGWTRKKKNKLVEDMNPNWEDLYEKLAKQN